MENYYEKFIKYKSKYLKLLNQLNMKGGGPNDQIVLLNSKEKKLDEVTTVANYENSNLIVSSDVAMDLIKSTHKLNEN